MEQRSIAVTPNVEYSLKVLGDSLNVMPVGEKKESAEKALRYLQRLAKGNGGTAEAICPDPRLFYPSGD